MYKRNVCAEKLTSKKKGETYLMIWQKKLSCKVHEPLICCGETNLVGKRLG